MRICNLLLPILSELKMVPRKHLGEDWVMPKPSLSQRSGVIPSAVKKLSENVS